MMFILKRRRRRVRRCKLALITCCKGSVTKDTESEQVEAGWMSWRVALAWEF